MPATTVVAVGAAVAAAIETRDAASMPVVGGLSDTQAGFIGRQQGRTRGNINSHTESSRRFTRMTHAGDATAATRSATPRQSVAPRSSSRVTRTPPVGYTRGTRTGALLSSNSLGYETPFTRRRRAPSDRRRAMPAHHHLRHTTTATAGSGLQHTVQHRLFALPRPHRARSTPRRGIFSPDSLI